MTKEVTSTTVKVAKMQMENGVPKAVTLPDEIILGNVSMEKAQKELSKKLGAGVTVFGVEPNTIVYEMPVEDFIKVAKVKQDEVPEEVPASHPVNEN